MAISAIGNINSDVTPADPSRIPVQTLGQQDFIKILVTQLTSQDPLNPQKDSEFIGQMAQFSTLESSKAMKDGIGSTQSQQEFLKANGLIGRNVELLDDIGNNISNSNTLGYKTARADFEDSFSQAMQTPSNSAGIQIGTGVTTGAVRSMFQQGTISRTGLDSDMAIDGDGFFTVKDPRGGQEFVTRAGDFRLDSDGYLVSNTGMRLQGYGDAGLAARGDIKIDATGTPA